MRVWFYIFIFICIMRWRKVKENVFVIGLGLIGGLLVFNIKKMYYYFDVIGFDIN